VPKNGKLDADDAAFAGLIQRLEKLDDSPH
jgi:hypothetical protein